MEILKKLLCLFIIFVSFFGASYSIEARNVIRVGISNQNFSNYHHKSASFTSKDELSFVDIADLGKIYKYKAGSVIKVEAENNMFKIYKDGFLEEISLKGPIVLSSNAPIGIVELNRKGTPAFYLGQIELKLTGTDKFNIINVLGMQDYLRGVVPNEMPLNFGLEALKAQAVAARNYANRDVNVNPNYDVCDSVSCQVYYGANSYRPQSDEAIKQTEGFYALYEREPIVALYFSTSSGITDSWEAVFSQNSAAHLPKKLPYLTSVYDNPDFKTIESEAEAEKFFSKPHPGNDIKSPKYRWSITFTKEELESILKKTLAEQSKTGLVNPRFGENEDFGKLKDIKVIKRGVSGKALIVDVISTNGTWRVNKELGIRRIFKKNNQALWSANFYIEKQGEALKQKITTIFENGEDDEVPEKKSNVKYIFYGAGFGHGVGMSQFGASYMAENGKNYIDILKHYYKGITVGTIPQNIEYSDYDKTYQIVFYREKHYKYFLNMDNTKRLSEMRFYVNNAEFTPNLERYSAKTLFFDITKYLHNGKNAIMIKSLSEKDKNKSTKMWLEVKE